MNRIGAGADEVGENSEMMALTEEGRMVNGDYGDKRVPLFRLRVLLQAFQIFSGTAQAHFANTQADHARRQLPFVITQNDPRANMKQLAYQSKLFVRQRELLGSKRLIHRKTGHGFLSLAALTMDGPTLPAHHARHHEQVEEILSLGGMEHR